MKFFENDTCFRFLCDPHNHERCENSEIAPINIDESLKNNNIVKTPCVQICKKRGTPYQLCINNNSICSQKPKNKCAHEWMDEDTKICRRNLVHDKYCDNPLDQAILK